ncbi:TniQ family protein [Paracoccus yeei]|uniref:TniQ family protein n=1 Tax=Paracoccus yeei TaxID=147645 RepID=UPI001CD786CE|nr:TniQ family protein [Paracoccus yeei]
MKSASRWPLHPEPQEGEALSSWLRRVAGCYDIDARELLKHDLGQGLHDDLDVNPAPGLLRLLSRRSGVDLKRLHRMSLAGWAPDLFDSLEGADPDALEDYAFRLTILLQDRSRATRSVAGWRAWRPDRPISRACPLHGRAGRSAHVADVDGAADAELPPARLLAGSLLGPPWHIR